jgi:hypothetical protein
LSFLYYTQKPSPPLIERASPIHHLGMRWVALFEPREPSPIPLHQAWFTVPVHSDIGLHLKLSSVSLLL